MRFQDDLFRAVNGTWIAKTEIPADRADYGAFNILAEQAQKDVRAIIESCASGGDNASAEEKKVGDLYTAYMDEGAGRAAWHRAHRPDACGHRPD